jgi:uncharacterized protein involved in exopolysaccharide biosynthesis
MTQQQPVAPFDDEISLVELFDRAKSVLRRLIRERRLLYLPMAIAAAIGLFIAFASASEYSAKVRLVPYRGGSAAGGLAGLAGLAGIRLQTGAGGDVVITYNLYPELARGLDFRIAVAETPLFFARPIGPISAAQYFRKYHRPSVLDLVKRYSVGLPAQLLKRMQSASPRNRPAARTDSLAPRRIDKDYRGLVDGIGSRIAIGVDDKSGIINIDATMPDPVAAASLAQVTADHLTKTIIAYEVRKMDAQLRFIEAQLDEVRGRYDVAQRDLARFVDRNRQLNTATSLIERARLERAAQLAFEVNQQLAREREQAIIKRNQDTPALTTLDRVTVPNTRSRPRRMLIMVASLLLGALVGLVRVGLTAVRGRSGSPVLAQS